jgi:hypothetical protein
MNSPPNRRYAVAVRDGQPSLVLGIRRTPQGDSYVEWPGRTPRKWDPHTSYHASGEHHHQAFGKNVVVDHRQPPDANFSGTQQIVSTPISADEPAKINVVCDTSRYSETLEISVTTLSNKKYKTHIAIDATTPNSAAIIPDASAILQQVTLCDAIPWILVTLFRA